MAEKLPAEILIDIFTRFLFNSKSNNFKKLIILRRTCKKWNEIILKCIFDELSKQNHKSWEIVIGVSSPRMYAAAELHSFDRINQKFNFNFPQQTIMIKPEQDVKVNFKYNYPFLHTFTLFKPSVLQTFINDTNNNQGEFSFILSNNDILKNENEVQLESLKIKAKIFWEKVYHIFDDNTFVELGKSPSYVIYGDPYFDQDL
ncbi:hypothetical protein RclHR1_01130013 [Rhizophagus clarus]|uniref:F-box domain-containing protein n=1 Tax=Rhizophagus clarus TaxID=94130 RepID=A0A2Z6QVM5_9GLOM|nr:hypothetical protein RclHR1_01130013 [Rhizophagus clarus]GES78434.1 hypothetical protein GLOIN_2v1621225 [Rhizophagus clarus]